MGAAIVLGARRGGVLLPLLVLPLADPGADLRRGGGRCRGRRVFGAPASAAAGRLLAAALPLWPLAAGAALRAAAE